MSAPWRIIDTGLRPAAENMAYNRAILDARREGAAPNTLRFLRFRPSALIGYHQCVHHELRLDYCREQGIEVQRRITGGGAIYFDETQLGWELYLDRTTLGTGDMERIAERVCDAAAEGMRRLGIDARYRPRNDIEVEGRKISGTGGAYDGSAILYQGTLLIDFDVERMLRVLRIPAEKLSDKAISDARDRVVNLTELLDRVPEMEEIKAGIASAMADAFGVRFEPGAITEDETARYEQALRAIDTEQWVYQPDRPVCDPALFSAVHRCRGGLLRADVRLDESRRRIKQVWMTGDFFVNPRRLVYDLEAALKDVPVGEIGHAVHTFFRRHAAETLLLQPADFASVVQAAVEEVGAAD